MNVEQEREYSSRIYENPKKQDASKIVEVLTGLSFISIGLVIAGVTESLVAIFALFNPTTTITIKIIVQIICLPIVMIGCVGISLGINIAYVRKEHWKKVTVDDEGIIIEPKEETQTTMVFKKEIEEIKLFHYKETMWGRRRTYKKYMLKMTAKPFGRKEITFDPLSICNNEEEVLVLQNRLIETIKEKYDIALISQRSKNKTPLIKPIIPGMIFAIILVSILLAVSIIL